MAAPARPRSGGGRTLAFGISGILAVGLATGVVAELVTPADPGVGAAAGSTTPQQERDSRTRQSLIAVSEAVETYYVTRSGPLTLEQGHTEAVLKADGDLVSTVKLAEGTRIDSFHAGDYSTWCVSAVNEAGTGRTFSMTSDQGILDAPC